MTLTAQDRPHWYEEQRVRAISPWAFPPDAVPEPFWTGASHDVTFSAVTTGDSLWILATQPTGARLALRGPYCPAGSLAVDRIEPAGTGVRVESGSAIGTFRTEIELVPDDDALLHVTTVLRPRTRLAMPYWPRDLYPLGDDSAGRVYTRQQGLRTGCVYFSAIRPAVGTAYYFQNLTALNDYAEQTRTSLAGVVGGDWPELGLALPGSVTGSLDPDRDTVISDAYLAFSPTMPEDEVAMAEQLLTSMARILTALPRRERDYVHWPEIAGNCLRDLAESPLCSERVDGERFLYAYVGDEETPPESMVQLAVLLPLREYAEWRGEDIALCGELRAGLPKFFDREIGVMGRWLISERDRLDGAEPQRHPYTMDSWYLYHSLLNLARMAEHGDGTARRLFLDSMDYAIAVAHRFEYRWPVLYNLRTLEVEVADSGEGESGENDVAALYTHIMLEAFELTGEQRYRGEAMASAEMLKGLGVDLFYQANVTLIGATALLRLAQTVGEERFREQAYVALAAAFNNVWLWECDYGYAAHYPTFMGLFPLRGAPYLAVLEASEGFSAAQHMLRLFEGGKPPWMTVLLPEFCRGLLHRASFYYPQKLPRYAMCVKPKTGKIDSELWIPVEDLNDGWEQAGQVGQEVYGAGTPFALVPRQYRRIPGAGFMAYVDYPIDDVSRTGDGQMTIRVFGDARFSYRLRLIPDGPDPLPPASVCAAGSDDPLDGTDTPEGHREYQLRGDQTAVITWQSGDSA